VLLRDRVAFLTGAGSGIGRAGAIALAKHGARVVVSDLSAARAEAVAAEILADGGRAEASALDVTDDAALGAAIRGTADSADSTSSIRTPASRLRGGWRM
jgi:NAD(P)-dependent dehydrogenase (short-subunit alcohol dehydrogenase family)